MAQIIKTGNQAIESVINSVVPVAESVRASAQTIANLAMVAELKSQFYLEKTRLEESSKLEALKARNFTSEQVLAGEVSSFVNGFQI